MAAAVFLGMYPLRVAGVLHPRSLTHDTTTSRLYMRCVLRAHHNGLLCDVVVSRNCTLLLFSPPGRGR